MKPATPLDISRRPWVLVPLGVSAVLLSVLAVIALYQATFVFAGPPSQDVATPPDMAWVEPADVYRRVDNLIALCQYGVRILYMLAALVSVGVILIADQIIVKIFILRPMVEEMGRSRLANEQTLGIAVQHGTLSDSKWKGMENFLKQAIELFSRVNILLKDIDQKAEATASKAEFAATETAEMRKVMEHVAHQTNSLAEQNVAGAKREGVTEGRHQADQEAADRGDIRGAGEPTLRQTVEEVKADTEAIKEDVSLIKGKVVPE